MTNPYAPPPIVSAEERRFELNSSVRSSVSFVKIGLLCAFVSGVIVHLTVMIYPNISGIWAMLLPGVVLGAGVFFATRRSVPNASRIGTIIFPFVAVASFALMGAGNNALLAVSRSRNALEFSVASFPGVFLLALGCLLIARPRSYVRFIVFVFVAALVTGIGPMFAFNPPSFFRAIAKTGFHYLLLMAFIQAVLFGMIGWIFGDTMSGQTRAVHGSDVPARS